MKINAENFIEKIYQNKIKEEVYLISGNDYGLINYVEKIIIHNFKSLSDYEILFLDLKTDKNVNLIELTQRQSLFKKNNIIKIKNPNDGILNSLNNINFENNRLILSGENISNNSKLKKYFDSHKNYYSISCYELTKYFKKKLIDMFLNKHNIYLNSEAYLFFIESAGNQYQLLNNELEKILLYGEKKISIAELRKLLTGFNQTQLDELFLQCVVNNNKLIVEKSNSSINSSADAYKLLQAAKNFSKILIKTSEKKNKTSVNSLVEYYLPKYLFKQKNNFEKIIIKADIKRLVIINKLLQTTELFLRKNDSNYLIIVQRFLLNCAKVLK